MKQENPTAGIVTQAPSSKVDEKQLKLNVEASLHSGTVVLHCSGRLIFRREAQALSKTVKEVLPEAGGMVVDLAGVEAVDSAGLGELVLLHMWAKATGYTMKFASPRKHVRELLELTNLASVFDLHSSVAEAIGAM